jgi:demethylmenaquinone methyltransferase / 2-methoxy-6-polyprenyl-1,4-benzoquinol methylase
MQNDRADGSPVSEHEKNVQQMFSSIARRYDLMNRLMTGGQDVLWRKEVIQRADLRAGSRLLDLGTGTGDLVFEALRQQPGIFTAAADFTPEMMQVGRERMEKNQPPTPTIVNWTLADALSLPFAANSFHAVVSGFLLRNVVDLKKALQEQFRVLKSGGIVLCLDTTRPPNSFLSPLFKFHLRFIIPSLGRIVTGQPSAYRYLPETTEHFLTAEKLAAYMQEAGLSGVGFRRLLFGAAAIHWGVK